METIVKCLSVRQPWATLIAEGKKTIEFRSWETKYRGAVLILAGSNVWRGTEYPIGPRGVSLCTVELVDVRPYKRVDRHAGCIAPPLKYRFSWVLESPRPVEQLPVKGALGLYAPPPELLEQLGLEAA